ncbi:MAG: FAD:protein FMN transferase [Pirellulaceae bacterium]|nr:FAD:protein FMN transferase [Pirellulaceae bacterium]
MKVIHRLIIGRFRPHDKVHRANASEPFICHYNRTMASPRKTTRRDFLHGRSAVHAISDLIPNDTLADPTLKSIAAPDDRSTYLLHVGRTAMACEFQLFLNAGQHPGATETALEALDLVDTLEDQLTVYRDHSEVSQLNRTAAFEPVVAERGLFDLLQQSVRIYEETRGAFDITSGPLTRVWGFHQRDGRFPTNDTLRQAKQCVGSNWLELDSASSSVRFLRNGLEINLGAIGKGYALDRCADLLRSHGIDDYLIHGGRSSVLAADSRFDEAHADRGWSIALRHPLRHEQQLGELWLRDRACGTSSSGNQFFHFAGKRYGHIIDPRSGYPADDLLSATVLAPTATEADALATAFFVMGADAAQAYCRERSELACLLIRAGSQTGSIEIQTHGVSAGDWQPIEEADGNQNDDPPTSQD